LGGGLSKHYLIRSVRKRKTCPFGEVAFFSYDKTSWIQRALLNEVSLTVQEFRKALSTGRVFYFLEGDQLPRSLYVRVSIIEDRKKTEEYAKGDCEVAR